MKPIFELKHTTNEFADSPKYLVCSSINKFFIYDRNNLKEPIAKVKCKYASQVAISNKEDFIYVLNTSGKFYLYNIADGEITKIPNEFKKECFSDIKVLPDDSCLWCAGNKLFKYNSEEQKTELLLEADINLYSILKLDSDSLYLKASDAESEYIVHFYFDGRAYYKKIKTYKSFSISKILHHKPSNTFVVVKGKKLFVPKGEVNFDDDSEIKLIKTDYKLKKGDVEDVKFSNNGKFIAILTRRFFFSKTLKIFDVKSRELVFESYADAKMECGLGQFGFSYDDKFVYISFDNLESGGFSNIFDLEKQ